MKYCISKDSRIKLKGRIKTRNKLGLVLVISLALVLTGCARISLKEVKVQLETTQTIFTLELGNKGKPVVIDPLATTLRDGGGSILTALDYTGDLAEPVGDDYRESVSGTIIFPAIDPLTDEVKIDIITSLLSGEEQFVSTVTATIVDGESTEYGFKR